MLRFRSRIRAGGPDVRNGGFSPLALLTGSTAFLWLDPSDLTTLFQDSAGITPLTAAGQPVGLVLDKSQGLVLGPELVTNGDFSSGSAGWLTPAGWSISGGQANAAVASGFADLRGATNIASIGKTYRVSFTVSVTSGGVRLYFGGVTSATTLTTSGAYSFIITASAADYVAIIPYGSGGSFTGTIDNISVRELPGNHATQATAASRPTYGIVPRTGRRNLLTRTEEFDNAVWSKTDVTVSANTGAAPDGTTTADKLVEGTLNAGRGAYFSSPVTLSAGNTTGSVYLKAAERSFGGLTVIDGANNRYYLVANLTNGAEVASGSANGSPSLVSKSITSVGNGWYRLQITLNAPSGSSTSLWVYPQDDATFSTTTTGNAVYQGDGTSGILTWGAQLEVGSTATAYQRVGSAFDVTEAGVPSLSYLSFDGVDDFLVTPTITPGVDKVTVGAGVRKLSDVAAGIVVEASVSSAANNGTVAIFAPSAAASNYAFRSLGTLDGLATATTFAAPITNVLTGLGDISGDRATLRVNGSQVAETLTDQGTGNYLAYPLYIGRRGGTSLPFNGQLYSLVVRFASTDLTTVGQLESWINGKTGAY